MNTFVFTALLLACTSAFSDEQADLANQLNNPVEALVSSVPFDYILDEKIGPSEESEVIQIKASPALPFSLNDEWNIVSRTIFSYVDQRNIPVNGARESGMRDIAESVFLSPIVALG